MRDIIVIKTRWDGAIARLGVRLESHCVRSILLNRTFSHLSLIAICMLAMLSARTNNEANGNEHHEDGKMLDISARDVFKDPAIAQLADAAANGDRQTISTLVRQGLDVNVLGDRDTSILQWAFWNKSIDGMLAPLDARADPVPVDDSGLTVMHYGAGIDDPTLLQALLDAGVSPNLRNPQNGQTPIFDALMSEREVQFRALLAAGADLNVQETIGDDLGQAGALCCILQQDLIPNTH